MIGADTIIMDSDMHSLDYLSRRDFVEDKKKTISKEVQINDDAFIGTRCIINKGVIIGERSIVASGSVVIKSIPSDQIWGGNPAKYLRDNRIDLK